MVMDWLVLNLWSSEGPEDFENDEQEGDCYGLLE
jgi:hypothetical protein